MSLRVHSEIDSVCLYHDLQTNNWTSFLHKIIDVIHQWNRLNELYKQMESFRQILELFFELTTIFQNNSGVGLMRARRGVICADQHAF